MKNKTSQIYEELEWRGLIFQSSSPAPLIDRLKKGPIVVYVGFDPTAESLHVGNLIPILGLRRFQLMGHRVVALIGGGTGLIGDPSGKSSERKLNTEDTVSEWSSKIKSQLAPFLDFDSPKNPALLLNNHKWISKMSVIDFLRDIGKHFSVNSMLSKESVKTRLSDTDSGMSYTEFSYMVLQAYDFLYLAENHDCELQVGGSDQYGNMVAGIELIRKKLKKDSYVVTFPLIVSATGKKFGKSEAGAIWLDPKKTIPYNFYQFWLNTDDRDVIQFLKYYTFLNKEEIEDLKVKLELSPDKREAHKKLAEEVTSLVHGQTELNKAIVASEAFFGNDEIQKLDSETLEALYQSTPSNLVSPNNIPALVDLVVLSGLSTSKSRARQEIVSGGIYVNNERMNDVNYTPDLKSFLHGKYLVVRRGKKTFRIIKK